MDIEHIRKYLEEVPSMITAMGMKFYSTPEADECVATMPVDERSCQPMGYVSGGALLALAEMLAGVGSSVICSDKECAGVNVSGNHLKAVAVGKTVTARAKLVGHGHTLHTWRVDITDEEGQLVSTANVLNYMRVPKTQN